MTTVDQALLNAIRVVVGEKEASGIQHSQNADQKKIREMEAKIAELQRRIDAIEGRLAGRVS